MFGTQHLGLFILTGVLLNLTPGQDTLYVVGRSVSHGRRAGLLSALGIASGTIVHTLAAAFGLSAILATSAAAFEVIRFAGAAYLMYLGIRLLIEKPDGNSLETGRRAARESSWSVYRAGLLTNVLNPKVALFFLAFLPQFVSPAAASMTMAFLFLGGIFVFTGTLWCLVLVWGASAMSERLRARPRSGVLVKRATGVLFMVLGARLALSR